MSPNVDISHTWVARTQLAALYHNANTGRKQATVTRGANESELQYKLVFLRHTKEWVTKPIMEKTSRDYLNPIQDTIVDRKKHITESCPLKRVGREKWGSQDDLHAHKGLPPFSVPFDFTNMNSQEGVLLNPFETIGAI